jgi:Na+-driven multidrug efflux pump
LAWCLSQFTDLPVVLLVFIVSAADIIKAAFGMIMVEKGVWINNLVSQ